MFWGPHIVSMFGARSWLQNFDGETAPEVVGIGDHQKKEEARRKEGD